MGKTILLGAGAYLVSNGAATSLSNTIIRASDGAFIPIDSNNMDYQLYQQWAAAGNTLIAVPTVTPTPIVTPGVTTS